MDVLQEVGILISFLGAVDGRSIGFGCSGYGCGVGSLGF